MFKFQLILKKKNLYEFIYIDTKMLRIFRLGSQV